VPSVIVKPDRTLDFYFEWSTVTDAVGDRGSYADMVADGHDPGRLDRADQNGSSATAGWRFGWWTTAEFLPRWDPDGNVERCPHIVRREHMHAWLSGDDHLAVPLAPQENPTPGEPA
jgi:hypothetical protein